METCDVLIVGGGPAGSSCAWSLRRAGLDVVVLDAARFPRNKVCAGWITPQVLTALDIDLGDYTSTRVCQPFTSFRTGLIGEERVVDTIFDHPAGYGIRRCEFDDYLLGRSGARIHTPTRAGSIKRVGRDWIVNSGYAAPVLVGAGGHFCPVAVALNSSVETADSAPLVVAREAEALIAPHAANPCTVLPERPELYFCPDLKGYGWCVRKQGYVNIGLGRVDPHRLPNATAEFTAFLERRGIVPPSVDWEWHGHAYLLHASARRIVGDGVLLVGDAAGLAYAQSGEGIRPAVESGLLAAAAIIAAAPGYSESALASYPQRLRERLGAPGTRGLSDVLPASLVLPMARRLLGTPAFVRHVVLKRWFLHAGEPALVPFAPAGGASVA